MKISILKRNRTMLSFRITAHASGGRTVVFEFKSMKKASMRKDGFSAALDGKFPCGVKIVPPPGTVLEKVVYAASTPLPNFHEVIVPDTGRSFCDLTQLVTFWGKPVISRIHNVRMPVWIFTGQDHCTDLAFGVVGKVFETDFIPTEPGRARALVAWMRRLTLEIHRGTDSYPIPSTALAADGSLSESVYFAEKYSAQRENWILTLRDFSAKLAEFLGSSPRTTKDTMQPFWCSWTDWHSDTVDQKLVMENVREGLKLGIKNYIIDDGWFGPGLDSDWDVKLNIGDWKPDPVKFPKLKQLVKDIHKAGGNAVMWCAPHAVGEAAECFEERKPYFMETKPGVAYRTGNGYYPLCMQCPDARQIMADLAGRMIDEYDIDGFKHDLFNNYPDGPCQSKSHRHDTPSMIEGLRMCLEQLDNVSRKRKKDFIVELKQNYGTPALYQYGTCLRAGDTPYNPEGNYVRTAYLNAYTPYSINDYQTLTNNDPVEASAAIIIKMLSVGIPTYSNDLPNLKEGHKAFLRFYHKWYLERLSQFMNFRIPLDADLGSWYLPGKEDIYFMVNRCTCIEVQRTGKFQIACGAYGDEIDLVLPEKMKVEVKMSLPFPKKEWSKTYGPEKIIRLPLVTGAMYSVKC